MSQNDVGCESEQFRRGTAKAGRITRAETELESGVASFGPTQLRHSLPGARNWQFSQAIRSAARASTQCV